MCCGVNTLIMDLVLCLFGIILFTSPALAFHDVTANDYYDYTSEDIKETKPPARDNTRTPSPLAKLYEVTEAVEDIPNPSPATFPIATNFTINKPLNIAGLNATGNTQSDTSRQNPKFRREFANNPSDTTKAFFQPNLNIGLPNLNKLPPNINTAPVNFNNGPPNVNRNDRKPPGSSNFELGDEIGPGESEFDPDDVDHDFSHEDFHQYPNVLPALKRYLYGLEKGIINGLNNLAGRDLFKGGKVNEPYTVTPVSFLNNLNHRRYNVHDPKNLHSDYSDEFDDY